MISKLESVLQELDETEYWLEVASETDLIEASKLGPLQDETTELISIFVAGVKRLKAREREKKSKVKSKANGVGA